MNINFLIATKIENKEVANIIIILFYLFYFYFYFYYYYFK